MENLVQQTIFATSSSRVRTTGHAYPQQVAMNVNVHLVGKERTVLIMSILAMVRYSFILHVVNFILDGPTPCQNGGECQLANGGMDFTCHCKNNYSGKYCELFHERAFDVFINQQPYRNWFKIFKQTVVAMQVASELQCFFLQASSLMIINHQKVHHPINPMAKRVWMEGSSTQQIKSAIVLMVSLATVVKR